MKRIGIFGGSFNPIHVGHLNSLRTIKKELELDEVLIVPSNQSPGRPLVEGMEPETRVELVKLAAQDLDSGFSVRDLEIKRGGLSYTIDSLRELKEEYAEDDLFLIVGKDQFEKFESWRDFEAILSLAHLVVTSRPGSPEGHELDEMPKLAALIESEKAWGFELNTGREIIFVRIEDIDISSSEIRRKIRSGEPVRDFLPELVNKEIENKNLYKPLSSDQLDYEEFVRFCAGQLSDKKAFDVVAKDMRGTDRPSEFTIICSGTSRKHATSLAENLIRSVKTKYGSYPMHIEGQIEGRWIVLDYGPVIIHVFYDFARSEYTLEKLWNDVKDFELNIK